MPGLIGVEVEGLADFQRSLRELASDVEVVALRRGLAAGAEPVAARAEAIAGTEISGMSRQVTTHWEGMRVGTAGTLVYIAPKQRGGRRQTGRRPNLGGRLFGAMERAAREKEADVVRAVELEMDKAIKRAGL